MSEPGRATTGRAPIERTCDPKRIAGEIDASGFSVVADYIGAADLKHAQDFVRAALGEAGGDCIILRGPGRLAGTFMYDLPSDPAFVKLCRDIYEAGTGHTAPESRCFQVLRCLCGAAGRKGSMRFHFDSYVLAALIPIIIPGEGTFGDLLLMPNARKIRRFYAASLVDKVLLASPFKQRRLRNMYACNDNRLVRIKLTPGSLYFFWGYMSAHASEGFPADAIRSTALFHYVDPHAGSRLRNILPTSRLKSILRPIRLKRFRM